MIVLMDEELEHLLQARELRSQHIPRSMSKHERIEEHIWTYHDRYHTGVLVGCADCEVIRAHLNTMGSLPSYVLQP